MLKKLIVFVDAFPYELAHRLPVAKGLAWSPLRPNFGYSVNLQAELFSGLLPDRLGYFCEMQRSRSSAWRTYGAVLRHVSVLENLYPAKRVVHRLLDRWGPYSHSANIPFRYLAEFAPVPHSVFDRRFVAPSPIHEPGCRVLSYLDAPGAGPSVDELLMDEAERLLSAKNSHPETLVVTQTHLDWVGHWRGATSVEFRTQAERVLERSLRLLEAARRGNPDVEFYLVSDHGMCDVSGFAGPDLEKTMTVGPRGRRCLYYADGTILRVWGEPRDVATVRSRLLAEPDLHVLTEEERTGAGLENGDFGQLIAVVSEGKMLRGNFWGPKLSRGMHGYHPKHGSQHGVFATAGSGARGRGGEVSSVDAYSTMFAARAEG